MNSPFVLSSGCAYISIVMHYSHRLFSLFAAIALPMAPAAAQDAAPQPGISLPSLAPQPTVASTLDWTSDADGLAAANHLIGLLETAYLEGFGEGPTLAAQGRGLLQQMAMGDATAAVQADRLLTDAFLDYAEFLQAPVSSVLYGDDWARPPRLSRGVLLKNGLAVPSLEQLVVGTLRINKLYDDLKQAALGAELDDAQKAKVTASLNRIRAFPQRGRFVLVDSVSQRLWMFENGQVVDHMKVVVGDRNVPFQHTPEISSVIYYSTHNPYWHVPKHLVQKFAGKIRGGDKTFLSRNKYQVVDQFGDNSTVLDASKVNWAEVEKTGDLLIRQLPSPLNSMGDIKFNFANPEGIYLHDTPTREYFEAKYDNRRDQSNGCIRLEDAFRFGRWLWNGNLPGTAEIEKHFAIPEPVPVFVTYLTANAVDGQLAFGTDIYNRDGATLAQVAARNARVANGVTATQGAPTPTMR